MFGKTVNKIKHKADEGITIQYDMIQETFNTSESSGNPNPIPCQKKKHSGIPKPFRNPLFTNGVESGGSTV